MADKKALEMQHIFKSFGGVHALRDVSFTAYEGKVNVLMGENGAGKSTLMRILAGAIQGDSGEIFIDGQKVNIYDPSSSRTAGIAMIYQELNLVPQLTVEANMYLGNEWTSVAGFVRIKDSKNKAQALLDEYDLGIDARVEVSTLSIAQQQMLEIAKAIASDAKIIVMDEPTSSLTSKEVQKMCIRDRYFCGIIVFQVSWRQLAQSDSSLIEIWGNMGPQHIDVLIVGGDGDVGAVGFDPVGDVP